MNNNIQNTLTDIQGLSENFKNKQAKIFKDLIRIGNLRNEVNVKVDSFANTLQLLSDSLGDSTNKLEQDMGQMKQLMHEEMKDMRAANKQFTYEIERNQSLYRAMHQELVLTIEEKKVQNNAIMDNAREATMQEKK